MNNCTASSCGVLYAVGMLVNLLLFGLMGLLGQGVRAAVGLKSAATLTAGIPTQQSQFNAAYFFLSLMIGFIAGILAGLGLMAASKDLTTFHPELSTLLGIAAAGYAGADFIENTFTHLIPGIGNTAGGAAPGGGGGASGGGAAPGGGAASGTPVPPRNPPPATVPVRLAVTGADPRTLMLEVDGRSTGVDANGFAELILESGITHTVAAKGTTVTATGTGTAVSGQITILVTPDDLDKAYELTLS